MTNLPASIPTDRVSPLAGSPFTAPPLAPTPILGREDDLHRARSLIFEAPGRLVTLTGPGGVGKTRLALALAESLRTDFPDGLAFVDLTPLTDPALVSPAIATALALRGAPEERLPSALAGLLRDRRMLLVLDNCEHVLPGVAPTVDGLLAAAPDLVVLATSREPLRLRREQVVLVDPLPIPNGSGRMTPADVATLPSVALFVSRARYADPRFALTEENAASVARLVTALDGLPLAIELAAARANSLGPAALAARAEHMLGLLRWDGADLPTRQRSLRATLDWSYGLLPEPEQAVLRRLGAFAGSFGSDAAAAVVDADGLGLDALDVLAGLADKGLVRSLGAGLDNSRFTLLETVREYARQRLAEQGEADAAARRLTEHMLVEIARTNLGPGSAQRTGLARIEADLDNLRVALRWAAEHGEHEIGLRLASGKGMWLFWLWRGHLVEGSRWLETFLAGGADLPRLLYAEGLLALAELVQYRGDIEQAENLWSKVQDAGHELGDARLVGWGTGNLGVVAQLRGDHERAAALTSEALAIHTEMSDDWGAAWAHLFLGISARNQGDLVSARRELEASAAGFARLDDDGGLARPLAELGRVSLADGQPGDAIRLIERALRLSMGDAPSLWNVVYVVEAAVALAATIHPERTARLLGGLDVLRSAMGLSRTPDERVDAEQAERATRAAIGDVAMAAEREMGGRFLPGDLVAEALAIVTAPSNKGDASRPAPSNPLSHREQEVLALVAEGLTSSQIGERLFVAEPTVKFHVRSILNKLGVSTRAQAVAEAARRGLL